MVRRVSQNDFWIKNRENLLHLYHEGMTVVSIDNSHATMFKLGTVQEVSKTAKHYPIVVRYNNGMVCSHNGAEVVPLSWYLKSLE